MASAGAFPGEVGHGGACCGGRQGVAAGDGAGSGDVAADGGGEGCTNFGCELFELLQEGLEALGELAGGEQPGRAEGA